MKQLVVFIFLSSLSLSNCCFSGLSLSKLKPTILGSLKNLAISFRSESDHTKDGLELVVDVVAKAGYPFETHNIQTSDGYTVALHRIPSDKQTAKRPIILTHCLMCSSSSWVHPGPDRGLAYLLSQNGYDVWMLNTRGTTYSKNHTYLQPTDNEYWNFSFHECSLEDLRYSIDYILDTTSHSQLDLLGFSVGTMNYFVLVSTLPEYNQKIRRAALMAPSGFFKDASSTFRRSMGMIPTVKKFYNMLGLVDEMPSSAFFVNRIFRGICNRPFALFKRICDLVWIIGEGKPLENVSRKRKSEFFTSFPNRISLKTVAHINQLIESGRFQQYDYGKYENIRRYGTEYPQLYNISLISVPTGIFWSADDNLETTSGIKKISTLLQNVILNYQIPHRNFIHSSFIWDDDVVYKLYNRVVQFLIDS